MMDIPELAHVIEAILFVAGEPVNVREIQRALDVTEDETRQAIDALDSDYSYHRRGITLKRFGQHQKQSLSQSALETLAVVAYKQPVTRLEIEAVRGVKCDYSVQSLVNKGLIEEVGRKEALGRPILYGTTDKFLSHFGLSSLDQLPAPPEPKERRSGGKRPAGALTRINQRSFLGETILWRPKNGFPQTPFQENHRGLRSCKSSSLRREQDGLYQRNPAAGRAQKNHPDRRRGHYHQE